MSTDNLFIVSGTGPRNIQNREHVAEQVEAILVELLTEHGDKLRVLSGGAQGFDHLLAIVAKKLGIPYSLVLPNQTFPSYYWGGKDKNSDGTNRMAEFNMMAEGATKIRIVTENIFVTHPDGTREHANFFRNTKLVKYADLVLAGVTSIEDATSGTANTIAKAVKAGKPIRYLPSNKSTDEFDWTERAVFE